MKLDPQTIEPLLSSQDILAIQQLNARYFFALDALVDGDTAANWAATFTTDGEFSLLNADGTVLFQVTGTQDLLRTYKTFTEPQTTRHLVNNLLIEPDAGGAKARCYIIAMSIRDFPATIIRSGVYKDQLVKVNGSWKFQSRNNSPVGQKN